MNDDWRLTDQIEYLHGRILLQTAYPQPEINHDHCEFCFSKFGLSGALTYGYCTEDHYYWICEQCFDDFKEMFEWQVSPN